MELASELPLIEELPVGLSAIDLFPFFQGQPYSFFLDSAMYHQRLGRYSLMGCDPFVVFSSRGDDITIASDGSQTHVKGNPFEVLRGYLDACRLDSKATNLPCQGGAVGYLSYDLGRFVEELPVRAVDDLNLPESCLGFYDLMLVSDHLSGRAFVVSNGLPEATAAGRLARARERLAAFSSRFEGFLKNRRSFSAAADFTPAGITLTGNFTREAYLQAVERARQYIIDGDIFEVNISQRFETELTIPPFELYCRLRQVNPAPFSAYLDWGEVAIASSSPERFLRRQGSQVETRPIKGTIRRGKTPEEDEANARWLLNSVKNRAENMMIVDLERNDLGRVCRFGTVKVTELAILETYPTLFHLTSTVEGELKAGLDTIDLLQATFPGGSITGAPKVRSMEIIDELEPTRRSVYTGSIGYLGFDGNLDLSIVIRTFLIKGKRACFQVGGAVVYDSDPVAEYEETLVKAMALFKALNVAGGPS